METITDRVSIANIVRERPQQLHHFKVKTVDGEAGTVARHQQEVDDVHLIIHLDRFLGLGGKDVVIEVDAIDAIDPEAHEIHVNRIASWVKESPKLGTELHWHGDRTPSERAQAPTPHAPRPEEEDTAENDSRTWPETPPPVR